jgi:hypothetical protein
LIPEFGKKNTYLPCKAVDSNIRHDAVSVPLGQCPFDQIQLETFKTGLSLLEQHGDLPPGYGIDPVEWGPDGYPTTAEITVGLRKKSYPISLPDAIWRPRAERWARACHTMDLILSAGT